jgi:hypothetical protein
MLDKHVAGTMHNVGKEESCWDDVVTLKNTETSTTSGGK